MFRYEEYLHSKAAPTQDSSQPQISQFVRSSKQQYTSSHPQQNAITCSVLSDLVIDCNLPLSIIEHPSFRRFFSAVPIQGKEFVRNSSKYVRSTRSRESYCTLYVIMLQIWEKHSALVFHNMEAKRMKRRKELRAMTCGQTCQLKTKRGWIFFSKLKLRQDSSVLPTRCS